MNLATSDGRDAAHLARDVRTSARITPDETRLHHVTTKIEGWVETLYVSATGQAVRRGQPLMTIYSPELLATQQEYSPPSPPPGGSREAPYPAWPRGGDDLLRAARRRLELWDISEAQIEALEATGQAAADRDALRPGLRLRFREERGQRAQDHARRGPAHHQRPLRWSGPKPTSTSRICASSRWACPSR